MTTFFMLLPLLLDKNENPRPASTFSWSDPTDFWFGMIIFSIVLVIFAICTVYAWRTWKTEWGVIKAIRKDPESVESFMNTPPDEEGYSTAYVKFKPDHPLGAKGYINIHGRRSEAERLVRKSKGLY